MITDQILIDKVNAEFHIKFLIDYPRVRFTSYDVILDGFFSIEELEYIIELMKKYGVKV
jgi:hypothetical protein